MGKKLVYCIVVILGNSSDGSSYVWMGLCLDCVLRCFSLTVFNSKFTITTTTTTTATVVWGGGCYRSLEVWRGARGANMLHIFLASPPLLRGPEKNVSLGPEPTLGGPACYSLPKSRFGSCRSFLLFARSYQIKDELHGICSKSRILKLL